MKPGLLLGFAAALAAAPVGFALADAGFAGLFDAARPVTLTGWVKAVRWTGPNVTFDLSAANLGETARTWTVQASAPDALMKKGLCRAALASGTHVTVRGYGALKPCERGKTCLAGGSAITFDDGETIDLGYRPDGRPLTGPMTVGGVKACKAPAGKG